MNKIKISETVFNLAVSHSRMKGKALKAAKDALVGGMLAIDAADKHGVSRQSVSACISRVLTNALKLGACPCCGQVRR